ncbi:zinc ribbon domain-containing protein [Sporobacter termitidis]|nr:zinc ribbon domain-containing protein [Sporobacter termitidis]
MLCTRCGRQLDDGAALCPHCGQPQDAGGGASRSPDGDAAERQRKRRGCLTAFILVLLALLLAATGVYFLVPRIVKPDNLGVSSSRAAYDSAIAKLGIAEDDAPQSGAAGDYTVKYGAPHDVDTGLTSEELTAFFNENRPPYDAVKNAQVRVNGDGTLEASANLDTGYVFSEVLNGRYTKQDAQKELPMLGLIPDNVNIYFKVRAGVEDNKLTDLHIVAVQVMGVTIPPSVIDSADDFITETLDGYISRTCARAGAAIRHAGISSGTFNIRGSLPSSVTRAPVHPPRSTGA